MYVWVQDDGRMMSPNAFDHLSFDNAPPVAPHVVAVNEYRERRAERSMPQRPERTPRELEPPQRDAAYDRGDRNERPPREQQYGARGGGGDWDNERRPRERSGGDRWDNDRRRATGRDERSGGGGGGWDNDGAERSPRERSMDGMERGNAGWRAPQDRSRVTGDRERTEYVQKPGDWQCADCGAMCFASRRECFKCRAPR